MKKADHWSGLVLLIFAGVICWGAAFLPYGSLHDPGPGFYPLWLGIILAAMSIGLIMQASRRKAGARTLRDILAEKVRWDKVLWVLIALLLYGFFMEYVGFLVATLLLMGFLLRVIQPQPWRTVLLAAATGSFGSYLVFELWMKLRLPKGFWGM